MELTAHKVARIVAEGLLLGAALGAFRSFVIHGKIELDVVFKAAIAFGVVVPLLIAATTYLVDRIFPEGR